VRAHRVVVVGAGMIGRPLAAALRAAGTDVLSVSRSAPADRLADLGTVAGRAATAAAVAGFGPDRVVLVHGPGDVSWIERNEAAARDAHVRTAELARPFPTILVSTDNVFAGTRPRSRVEDPPRPANAYGRVKLAAERALPGAAVLRVSLVYGGSAGRLDYVRACLADAAAGRRTAAPVDQRLAPVLADDVVAVLAGLARGPHRAGIAHLAGPVELSRYELARFAYAAAGADPGLVVPARRAATRWACRPAYSSLASDPRWPVRDPATGVAALLAGSPA
jgi:dTDP-4-dehydrorhamnose reductase